jgi:hypothetical protein
MQGITFSWKELWETHRGHKPYQRKFRELRSGRSAIRTEKDPPVLIGENSFGKIRMLAEKNPDMVFTSLAHRIDLSLLRDSFRLVRKSKSAGVDGVTAKQYAENLDANLCNLYQRLRRGQYACDTGKTDLAGEGGRGKTSDWHSGAGGQNCSESGGNHLERHI